MNADDASEPFDFDDYLGFLERHHHNFIRLWCWESTSWDLRRSSAYTNNTGTLTVEPHPWARTGKGRALDAQSQFDLSKFEIDYFDRLRERVEAADERGMYVSIMLFEGRDLQHSKTDWKQHPFHRSNNVNGIDGDPNNDGLGIQTHTLDHPAVTEVQQAYVRKVIDSVNDLDNVLYEIANETGTHSTEWQYHLIHYIRKQNRLGRNSIPWG